MDDNGCAGTLSRKREAKQSLCLCPRLPKGTGTGVSIGVHSSAYLLTPEYGVYVLGGGIGGASASTSVCASLKAVSFPSRVLILY